jgi:glycosyltransferase involved in cell wall biosynthesis
MRCAYLINQYPKVSHTFIRREILALERQGLDVHRYALRGWADVVTDVADEAERLRTHYVLRQGPVGVAMAVLAVMLGSPRRFLATLCLAMRMARQSDRSWLFHVIYLAEACLILVWCRRDRISHLHAHFGTNPAEVAMLAHALGGPNYSFTVHGPEEFDKPHFIGLAEKICRARFVVAISSFGKSQLCRWVAFEQWEKFCIVHCGLEQDFHTPQISMHPVGTDRDPQADEVNLSMRLVCVGRFCEQKAQLLLVEATRHLLDRGLTVELVLAGDGEMRPQIEARARVLNLGTALRITGWISSAQVREEILQARALVLPSYAEGLPVVLMEAMALARPVISTYVAGIPELVQVPDCGWLVPAGDVRALVDAMVNCLEMPAEGLRAMGMQARARVLARHDIDIEAAKLLSLFQGDCLPADA